MNYVRRGILYIYVYKDQAAPPIGGPALHDSRVKTVQWRNVKVMTPTKRFEVYIYTYNIYNICDKYSSRNCGIVLEWFRAHTLVHILAMGCGAVQIGGTGKGSSKPSFESGGLFRDDVG